MDIQGLKDKILQLAIQGKLVEQDKNDEPASVLLESIKEERDRLVKEKKIRKQKPLPEIMEEEKPFEIPGSWEWVRLGEISLQIPSKQYQIKQSDIVKEGRYPVVSQSINLIEGYSNAEDKLLMIGNPVVIFGDHTRHVKYIDFNFIVGADGIKIINPLGIYDKFLYLSILYNALSIEDRGYSRHFRFLNKKLIPLPPFAEQKRIVEKVDELFALIDELGANKEDLLEVINLIRNRVLQEAIQGKLVEQKPEDERASVLLDRIKEERDKLVKEKKIRKPKKLPPIEEEEKPFEIPGSWEWVRLGEIGAIVGGGTPKTAVKEYWEGGTIPWLTPADLSNYTDKYISRGKRNITPLGLKESSAQLMPKGTVLFSSRAPIGYTVIAQNEISTNQGFKSCIPFIVDMNEYLYYYLIYSAKLINENASGTTFKEVSGREVSKLILPLPPLTEQKRIVEKVDIIMDMLDELEKIIME